MTDEVMKCWINLAIVIVVYTGITMGIVVAVVSVIQLLRETK